MRKVYLATIVLAMAMMVVLSSAAQATLLSNAGFESPGGEGDNWKCPTDWATDGTAAATGQTNYAIAAYEGDWVFTVDQWGGGSADAWGYAAQDVTTALNTGDTATLNMYIATDADYTGSAKAKLEFLNDADVVLGTALSSSYGADTPWTLATASGLVPDGTVKLNAYALSENMGIGSKSAYFDAADLTVTPIPEPTSLLLLGSGLIGLLGFAWRKRK